MIDSTSATDPLRGIFVGALLGGALGYLCGTAEGRALHRQVDAWLDRTIDEMRRLQVTLDKCRTAMDEGRRAWEILES